jgi:hypothetical protein
MSNTTLLQGFSIEAQKGNNSLCTFTFEHKIVEFIVNYLVQVTGRDGRIPGRLVPKSDHEALVIEAKYLSDTTVGV